jgi:PIN domain nuclease of toxin-antitoxin system
MILDTHAWLRYLGTGLSKAAVRRIDRARTAGQLRVAAITLWEIALLVHTRRLRVDGQVKEWIETALARSGATVAPLDAAVAFESARLIGSLRDPADCQIVGTAIHLGVPLATRDARILAAADGLRLDVVEI